MTAPLEPELGIVSQMRERLPSRGAIGLLGLVSLLYLTGSGACGPAAGEILGKTAGALGKGLGSGSGRSKAPGDFTAAGPYCGLFKSHGRACPSVASCSKLAGGGELQVNACERDSRLRPVAGCQLASQSGKWCVVSEFPACSEVVGSPCDYFEQLVCVSESKPSERRLVDCCVGGAQACDEGSYVLAELMPDPVDAGLGDDTGPGNNADPSVADATPLDAGASGSERSAPE